MNLLLWHALFFRVLFEQKKLFATAVLTVSLGVALALGIRLGTQSALNSLEQSVGQAYPAGWSDPFTATTAEAKIFLTDVASRFGGQLYTNLEAQWEPERKTPSSSQTLLVHVFWGGDTQAPSPRQEMELNAQSSAAVAPEDQTIELVAGSKCRSQFPERSKILLAGKRVDAAFQTADAPFQLNSCRHLSAGAQSFSSPELSRIVNSAPLLAIFPVSQPDQKKLFDELKILGSQVPGLEIQSNQNRISRLEEVTVSFRTNLQLMGFIALFIGFAIVHHVFSLLIARQSRSLAVLGALGIAQSRQIKVLFSLAAFLGLAASLVGIFLGLAAGTFLSNVTSSTIKNLYESFVDSSTLYWTSSDLAYGFLLGFSACLLGALHPIFKLKKLPVAQVMREGSFESHESGLTSRQNLNLIGAILVLSLTCLSWPWVWNRIPITALLACLGFLVISALLAQQLGYLLYKKLHIGNWPSRWSTQLRIFFAPQAAVVLQVLTLTFTLTFGVKGMAESFRQTLSDWSQNTLKADLWIRTVGGAGAPLPFEVIERLEGAPDAVVQAVDRLSIGSASLTLAAPQNERPVLLAAARFQEQAKVAPMKILVPAQQSDSAQAKTAAKIYDEARSCAGTRDNPCPAYISEPVVVHFNLSKPLDSVLCPTFRAQQLCFRVASVYQDFGSDQGVILTDEAVFRRLLENPPLPSFSNVYLRDPNAPEAKELAQELRLLAENSEGTLSFETLADLRARILQTFDNTFRVTDALYVLCGIIAIVATVSCLNLQIRLRSREWSLQWALGIDSQTLLRRFSLWSALMALLSSAVSLLGGWILSAILVYAVNYYSFGYSLSLAIPWTLPMTVVGVATLSGYISGRLQTKSLSENTTLNSLVRE
jgi:putative ABC transport system permease protein